jgi:hypothetical protein
MTSSPSSITGTGASPITVSGLANGTAYTFTTTATNANGTSVASSASNSVTPTAPANFVAFGFNTTDAASSADGETWTARTIPTSGIYEAPIWSSNKWFSLRAGTNTQNYLTSPDGVTWTNNSNLPISRDWRVSASSGSITVLADYTNNNGSNPLVASSNGGTSWTQATLPDAADATRVMTYGLGYFFAIRSGTARGFYSSNGTTWTLVDMGTGFRSWGSIAFGAGVFTAGVTDSTYGAWSDDLVTWNAITRPNASNCMIFGNNLFVSLNESTGTAYSTSTNGTTWTSRSFPTSISSNTFGSLGYNNGTFVVLNRGTGTTRILSSTSGTGSWTTRTLPTSQNWESVAGRKQ